MTKSNISVESLAPFFQAVENLTMVQRILIYVGTLVVLIACFLYLSLFPKLDDISKVKNEYEKLDQRLTVAKKKARQLDKFQKMMKNEEGRFKVAMKALPNQKQIPALLTNISQSGQDAGLEFLLFQPRGEKRKDFYSEIPVSINVTGSYHNVALFFDRVSKLPRVVNIENINFTPIKGGRLKMACSAVTYRFVQPTSKKKKPKRRRR